MAAQSTDNQNPSTEHEVTAAENSAAGGTAMSSKPSLEKMVFPPPPMWYKTNAVAARHDMWAYLSMQQLILVRPKEILTKSATNENGTKKSEDESMWPTFQMFGFSKDGYCCMSFCQSAWDCLPVKCSPLVTGCREGFVRIWNVETGECVMYHDLHKESKNLMVNCIDWCSRNPKVIYSMDEEGTLVSWYIPKSTLKAFSFGKIIPSSLHCSPHEDNIVCIGSKGGNIYIVKTDPGGKASPNILHRVRHDEEIISTMWCPSLEWRLTKNEDLGHIFASTIQSVKSPQIRLWGKNAEDRGLYQVGEKEKPFGKVFKNFTPILWAIDPNSGEPMLITTAKRGEVVAYMKDSTLFEPIHHVHNGVAVFGLAQCGDILWSTSFEPVICGFNLRTMTVSCVIPCFRGVCSITPSPTVGTKMGVGGVDGCIRAIEFGKDYPQKNAIHLPVVSYRLKSKVLSLSWHPSRDNLLGFGTDDGIVGLFEIHETQKHTRQFERHVKGAVYAVDWGPMVRLESQENQEKEGSGPNSNLYLYACGGGSAVMIHPSDMKNPMINVISIANKTNAQVIQKSGLFGAVEDETNKLPTLKSKVADIRWSPDFKIFAVGYNDGRVELYAPPFLELKCWIKCHSRAIQYLSWRLFDFQPDRSDHKDRWLATCANDGTCRLFNLNAVFESLELPNEPPKLIISSAATLRSPNGERIISSSWSPHNPDLILTVSYDSTGILWNIKEGTPISRYFGHCHRLVACAFHPSNEYLILSASDEILHDFTFHVWDYRDHPFKENRLDFKIGGKEKPLHIKSKEQIRKEEAAASEDEDNEVAAASKKDPSSHLHVVDESVVNASIVPPVTARNQKKKGKGKGAKSLLSSTANMFINSKTDLEKEIKYIVETLGEQSGSVANGKKEELGRPLKSNGNGEANKDSDGDSDNDEDDDLEKFVYLDLLGDFNKCVNLMKLECDHHVKKGDWERGCLLATWMGDDDFIENAVGSIDASQITETIVLLSLNRSPKALFKKACSLFADRLVLEEEFTKAATFYYLAGDKEKAVQVLVQNKLFRDAVALMKLSIFKTNPIHVSTVQKWLVQLTQDGNFETACKVYTSLGLYGDALGVIEKRDINYAWRTGMYLAKLCGDQKKLELLALKLTVDCMAKRAHEGAKRIIVEYELHWLKPMILAHESVFNLSNQCRDNAMKDHHEDVSRVFPKGEFKKNLMNSVGRKPQLSSSDVTNKLRDTLVVAVAQNKSDAEIILVRSLVFVLFRVKMYEDVIDDYEKLCQSWFLEQDPYLYTAYMMAINEWIDD